MKRTKNHRTEELMSEHCGVKQNRIKQTRKEENDMRNIVQIYLNKANTK